MSKKDEKAVAEKPMLTQCKFFAPAIEAKMLNDGETVKAVANIAKIKTKTGKFGEYPIFTGVFQWRKEGGKAVMASRKMFVPSGLEEYFNDEKLIGKRLVFSFTAKERKLEGFTMIEGFEGSEIDPAFL